MPAEVGVEGDLVDLSSSSGMSSIPPDVSRPVNQDPEAPEDIVVSVNVLLAECQATLLLLAVKFKSLAVVLRIPFLSSIRSLLSC